jgi:hypothetical protein
VTLRRQVVNLVWLNLVDQGYQAGAIGEVSVVKVKTVFWVVRITVKVIDSLGVKGAGTANNAVNRVALGQQEFCQV